MILAWDNPGSSTKLSTLKRHTKRDTPREWEGHMRKSRERPEPLEAGNKSSLEPLVGVQPPEL